MKFTQPISVKALAARFGAELIGDEAQMAGGINEIHKVTAGDITFVDVEKYFQRSLQSAATVIILNKRTECPPGKTLLLHDNPFLVYDTIVREHRPFMPLSTHISETAVIHPTAILEPNVIIGHHVTIDEGTYIQANSYIGEHTHIGKNVVIQAGCIIGTDAFYFKKTAGQYQEWRSGGRVIIEDNVRIGAGCTINKGVSGDTIIGAGSKLDCQVHIGHGVVIGKNCLLAAQVGIGGKTVIGDDCVLYGQVGIAQNITIGPQTVILAKSGVGKNLEGGKTYFGIPVSEAKEKFRELVYISRLPELFK